MVQSSPGTLADCTGVTGSRCRPTRDQPLSWLPAATKLIQQVARSRRTSFHGVNPLAMDDRKPVERASSDGELGFPVSDGPPALEEREFFLRRGMTARSAAIIVFLTAFAIFMVIRGPAGDTALQVAIGRAIFGLVAMFGVVQTVRLVTGARSRRPSLKFDRDGITQLSVVGPPIFVPWDEIVSLNAVPRAAALEIELRNPSSLKLTWRRRLTTWMLRRTRDTDLVIPSGALDVPSETIVALAHEWKESQLLNEVRSGRVGGSLGESVQKLREHSDQRDSGVT